MQRSLILAALLLWPGTALADLRVVATTADLAAVAREVGGDHVRVTALALPTQDPHFVDARPSLALDLARADVLLVVGLELEVGWLPTLQVGSRNPRIQAGGRGFIDCSQYARVLEAPARRVDRSMGDVHAGGNPHYMLDPRQAASVARGVAQRMASLDPPNAAHYRERAAAFATSLDAARARWERRLSGLRGTKVIAYHKSFPYLADWLGFRVVEHIEPRPGIPPNPRHVAHVLSLARNEGVRLLLQEAYYPGQTAQLIAERTSGRLVVIPAGPNVRGGETYGAWMERVVTALARAAPGAAR